MPSITSNNDRRSPSFMARCFVLCGWSMNLDLPGLPGQRIYYLFGTYWVDLGEARIGNRTRISP